MKITNRFTMALVVGFASALLAGCSIADVPPTAAATPPTAESNLDLEKGFDGWRATEMPLMSGAQAEAAHTEKMGLRIEDQSDSVGSSVFSPQVAVAPEQTYQLSFWSKTAVKNGGGVWARFYNQDQKIIGQAPTFLTNFPASNGAWAPFKKELQTPAETAFVAFWIHTSTAAQGTFDFDDFSVTKIGDATAATPTVLPAPVARVTPAYIIIKADDLIYEGGSVNPKWQQFVNFTRARNIPASIGIITNSLEADHPAYFQWIKDQNASGLIEFWNHGYDHKQWTEDDKTLQEFKGPTYELQKQHLERGDQLAREKLGFAFHAFGAPFNATDANTVKALDEDSDIQVWLYGDPKNPAQKTVIDRVPQVNIEAPTFEPDALKFAQGYNQFPQQEVFAIQGHPTHWTPERFAQFVQIIDFLTEAKAVFVTPSQYARLKQTTPNKTSN